MQTEDQDAESLGAWCHINETATSEAVPVTASKAPVLEALASRSHSPVQQQDYLHLLPSFCTVINTPSTLFEEAFLGHNLCSPSLPRLETHKHTGKLQGGRLGQSDRRKAYMTPALLQPACVTWTKPLHSPSLRSPSVKWGDFSVMPGLQDGKQCCVFQHLLALSLILNYKRP